MVYRDHPRTGTDPGVPPAVPKDSDRSFYTTSPRSVPGSSYPGTVTLVCGLSKRASSDSVIEHSMSVRRGDRYFDAVRNRFLAGWKFICWRVDER
jgi:hypothetical protein